MKSGILRSVLSSSVGNVIEWYEYTLYAYFAIVITKLFFPLDNHFIAMILTFTTFAVGLAARPIGGIIFGYIGDRISRRKSLTITMLMMSIPTMCIGLLPTYAEIGIMAPIILVFLRITQGIALGGEFGSSCVYLYESVPKNKRGFFGCLALTGVGTGLVLSSLTIFIVESYVSEEQLYSFAWRLPFFISVVGGFLAFYMRKHLLEPEDFIKAKVQENLVSNPFMVMIRTQKINFFKLATIFLTTQVSFFVVFVYGKTMMINGLGFSSKDAGKFNLITVLSYTISTLIFGYLSDKLNKRLLILIGCIGLCFSAYPFISSLKTGDSSTILVMCILMGILIGMTEGILNPVVAETFPVNIRTTSVAFCWNFTSVSFGAVSPIICMGLIENFSVDAVAYYLIVVCLISITSLIFQLKWHRCQNA